MNHFAVKSFLNMNEVYLPFSFPAIARLNPPCIAILSLVVRKEYICITLLPKRVDGQWATEVGEEGVAADSVAAQLSEETLVKALGTVLGRVLEWDRDVIHLRSAAASLIGPKGGGPIQRIRTLQHNIHSRMCLNTSMLDLSNTCNILNCSFMLSRRYRVLQLT